MVAHCILLKCSFNSSTSPRPTSRITWQPPVDDKIMNDRDKFTSRREF